MTSSGPAEPSPLLSPNPPTVDQSRSSGESSNADRWFQKSDNTRRPGTAALMDGEYLQVEIFQGLY